MTRIDNGTGKFSQFPSHETNEKLLETFTIETQSWPGHMFLIELNLDVDFKDWDRFHLILPNSLLVKFTYFDDI